jgi:hypothetical protein
MPNLKGVGATLACLREAASAKAGRPLEREDFGVSSVER